jgi:hypothetical protein
VVGSSPASLKSKGFVLKGVATHTRLVNQEE